MKLSDFLKKIASFRKKKRNDGANSTITETEWIKNFFIAAGAAYIAQEENKTKVNSLLKHVFSPSNGRTAISVKLACVVTEKYGNNFWNLFFYVYNNIKIDDIELISFIDRICKDEKIDTIKDDGPKGEDVVPKYINERYNGKMKEKICIHIIIEYFYYLVKWEIVTHSIPDILIDKPLFSPDIEMIFKIHDTVICISENKCLKNCVIREYWSYLELSADSKNDICNYRLYFPLVKNYYYYNYANCNSLFYISDSRRYVVAIRKNMLVIWNLNEPYIIKYKEDISLFAEDVELISIIDEENKILIKTKKSVMVYIGIDDLELSFSDYRVFDSKLNLFIRHNTIYKYIGGEFDDDKSYTEIISFNNTRYDGKEIDAFNFDDVNSFFNGKTKVQFSDHLSFFYRCDGKGENYLVRTSDHANVAFPPRFFDFFEFTDNEELMVLVSRNNYLTLIKLDKESRKQEDIFILIEDINLSSFLYKNIAVDCFIVEIKNAYVYSCGGNTVIRVELCTNKYGVYLFECNYRSECGETMKQIHKIKPLHKDPTLNLYNELTENDKTKVIENIN